jgi:tRNA pseudouridine38-40 synthase
LPQFALKIGYLPSHAYSGFSHQLHDQTNILTLVVRALEKARLIQSHEKIPFASRTDRGVGALSQVVSFQSSINPILPEINSYLPLDIRVLAITSVPDNFDPRHDAILRTYSYQLVIDETFDLIKAENVVNMFSGTHDFRNFAKVERNNEKNTVKTIESINLSKLNGNVVRIIISSRSFLWQQIRRMMGHIIDVATNNLSIKSTQLLLENPSRIQKPPSAPAESLILEDIMYENIQFDFDSKSVNSFRRYLIHEATRYKAQLALHKLMIDSISDKK